MMKNQLALVLGGLGLVFAATAAVNCDAVDAAFDCQAVCSRYRDCYDTSYNVDACRNSCRANAASDPGVKQAADACEACIGQRSCLSSTFVCSTSCGRIVP